MNRYVCQPLEIPVDVDEVDAYDLVFYGVDHSGPSYQARVYLNNPNAELSTPMTVAAGYVGSFSTFGHNGCYGEEGHCDPNQREVDEFDFRAQHPLTPCTKTVVIDTTAQQLLRGSEVTVTVVAVDISGEQPAMSDALSFERVRLFSYVD